MKLLLATLGTGFGSALLPFINIEAYLTAVGAAHHGSVWWLAGAAALGQTSGKVVLYYGADWAMSLPWIKRKMAKPTWEASNAKWRTRVEDHPRRIGLILMASAALGFPPLLLVAVIAGQLRVNIWLFVVVCLTGRYARFLVLLGAADWIVHLF